MSTTTQALTQSRRQDSDRRRQRVQTTLKAMVAAGEEISVAAVARKAKVSRAFLYRHGDLHAKVAEQMAVPEPAAPTTVATAVSRASLLAEVANQREQNLRLARHIQKLEAKLSDLLGEQVFRASGLGGPDDTEQLRRRVSELEQTVLDLRGQLTERGEELDAARATNRELMAEVNRLPGPWPSAGTTRQRTPRR